MSFRTLATGILPHSFFSWREGIRTGHLPIHRNSACVITHTQRKEDTGNTKTKYYMQKLKPILGILRPILHAKVKTNTRNTKTNTTCKS